MYNGKYLDVSHFGDPYERILQWILRFFRYIPTSLKGFLRIPRNFLTQHVIFLWYFFLTELEFFFSDLQPIFFKKTSDSRLAWITQLVALAFGAISLAIAFLAEYLGGVLQASLTIFGVVGGPLFGLFTIGMFSTAVEEKVSWWSILFIRSQRSFRFHSDCFVLIKDSWSWIRFSVIRKRKKKKRKEKLLFESNQFKGNDYFVKGRTVWRTVRTGVQSLDRIRRTKATYSSFISEDWRLPRVQHNGRSILNGRNASDQPDHDITCRTTEISRNESHRSGYY